MAPVNGYRLPLPVRQKHRTNQCSDQSQSLSLRLSPFHHRCPWSIAGTPWAVAGPWLTRLTERKKEPSTGVAKGALRSTSKLIQICDLINALHTSYHDTTSSMYIIYIYACVCVCVCLCVCAYICVCVCGCVCVCTYFIIILTTTKIFILLIICIIAEPPSNTPLTSRMVCKATSSGKRPMESWSRRRKSALLPTSRYKGVKSW